MRAILLGQGLLLQGLRCLLDAEPSVDVAGVAESWPEVRNRISGDRSQVLIVDQAGVKLGAGELAALLGSGPDVSRVIWLDREENLMIVHDLKRIADARVADLVRALGNPAGDATSENDAADTTAIEKRAGS